MAALGAERTFDYRRTDAADLPPASFDAVIDIAGTAPLRTLISLLRPGGRVVLVAGAGGRVLGPLGRMLRAVFVSIAGGGGRSIRPLAAVARPEVTRQLVAFAGDGRLRPVIERSFELADAGAALAHMDAGHTVGKVVVTVS